MSSLSDSPNLPFTSHGSVGLELHYGFKLYSVWVISEVLWMVAAPCSAWYDWIQIMCGANGTVAAVTKVHCPCIISCCV